MVDTIHIILILFNIVFFLLGYTIGKSSHVKVESQPISFFKKQNQKDSESPQKVAIDGTKFVTDIKTSDLVKKYEELGDIKVSTDNIESSIDKLKNLKR